MRPCHHPTSSNARRGVATAVDLKAKVDFRPSVGLLASEHAVKPMIGAGVAGDAFRLTEMRADANTEASFSVTRWG